MFIFIELLIFLSTALPVFHLLNALTARRRKHAVPFCSREKEFSLLIPCYNEEDTVETSIKGLAAMDYHKFVAIYINDGSSDGTLDVLDRALGLQGKPVPTAHPEGVIGVYQSQRFPNIFVIDQENRGKSAALNTGIHFAKTDLIVTLDADSILEKSALAHMNRAFEDEKVVAAGGAIHVLQGYDPAYLSGSLKPVSRLLITLQILEYLKGFYIFKMSLSRQQALAIISGAFGVFRKRVLLAAGGFRATLGEDIDMTIRIHRLIQGTGHKVLFLPEALGYTQCPESWHDLKNQRIRWQKGFIDCARRHKWFILKTFLFKSICFHLLVEAELVGLCSSLFTVLSHIFVIILACANIHTLYTFIAYYAFCLAFGAIYAACAIYVSVRYNRYPGITMKKTAKAVVADMFFYRYFTLFMYLGGAVAYFWNRDEKDCWNKAARNNRHYLVSADKRGGIDG